MADSFNENNVDDYCRLLNEIQEAKRKKQYKKMLDLCELSWPLIPDVIQWDK